MNRLSLKLIFLLLGSFSVLGLSLPEKGVPLLDNYSPSQYFNNGKVWSIAAAPNGIIYMAADGGLLEFDGRNWAGFRGSAGITRSILVVNDSLIYTGSDLDFGVWRRNISRGFDYTSLYPFLDDLQEVNEEFWRIHKLADDILFVSSRNIYIYRNGQLVKIAAPTLFTVSFEVDGNLYFADENQGLFQFEDFSLKNIFVLPHNFKTKIVGLYNDKSNNLIVVTRDLGLFLFTDEGLRPLNNALSEKLASAKVFSFEKIGESYIAFGTVISGIFIAERDGNILHHVNRHKGLFSNTVLSMHYSQAGKLWLGLDYGVSAFDLKSNITTFYDYRGDFGTGNTSLLKDGLFYLGTNQGLYSSPWESLNNSFEFFRFGLIPGTEGQVWTLANIENNLLMGHDRGLFLVSGRSVERLNSQTGVWTIIQHNDYLLTGNYNGISIYHRSENKWKFLRNMELIYGSCNQIIVEKDNILWINIPTFGIIRAVLDQDLNPEERIIFPNSLFAGGYPYLQSDERGIHLITDRYHYTYDSLNNEFTNVKECPGFQLIEGHLPGVYQPSALHPDYEFLPLFNGFALTYLKSNSNKAVANHHLVFRKVEAFNNHERMLWNPRDKFPNQLNNIILEFIIPNQRDVLYQYKVNESGSWSQWKPDNTVELLGLRRGKYKFFVRAKIGDSIIEKVHPAIIIASPWYFSWYAFVLYVLFVLALSALILAWQRGSLKKQKKMLIINQRASLREQTEKHKQQIFLLEQKRLQAEYNQIKQQLVTKTIELAKKGHDIEEKNRLLLSLKEKCEKAKQNPAIFEIKWGEIQKLLDSYLKSEDKTFEIQMDELHQEFFKKLKDQFSDLSNNDLRLCAYVKIGLNSKEIADMLNIQPSSFYISRSRLRKKLNLQTHEDLYTFLNAV